MPKIKLKDWAAKNTLSYITANRHFHLGLIPNAEQLDSGTILVNEPEPDMSNSNPNTAMSLFLKKTIEYSKNNSSVEDFAAYVISNFQLKLNGSAPEAPRYSKNKPKPEETQKHFQQFLPNQEEKDRLKSFAIALKEKLNENNMSDEIILSDDITDIENELISNQANILYTNPGGAVESIFQPKFTTSCYIAPPNQLFSVSNIATNCSIDPFNQQNYYSSAVEPQLFHENSPLLINQDTPKPVVVPVELENLPRKRGRKPTKKV